MPRPRPFSNPRGPLPEEVKDFHAYAVLARRLQTAIQRAGISLPPSNRFERYARLLDAALSSPGDTIKLLVSETTTLNYGMVDIDQASLIVETLDLRDPRWHAKLRTLLSGHERPDIDRNPLARNTQAELYFAAVFRRAGMRVAPPTRPNDPVDFFITADGWTLGIEAKRVTSATQILPHVKSADRQLKARNACGLVALDLTPLTGSPPALPRYAGVATAWAQAEHFVDSFTREFRPLLQRKICRDTVAGLVIGLTLIYFNTTRACLEMARSLYVRSIWGDGDIRWRRLAGIQHRFVRMEREI